VCLRASSWRLWTVRGSAARIPRFAGLKWSANHTDAALFSALSMWYLDTHAVLAQLGNASPWAKETENPKILGVAFKSTAHMGDGRSVLLNVAQEAQDRDPRRAAAACDTRSRTANDALGRVLINEHWLSRCDDVNSGTRGFLQCIASLRL
jgi:hypothetical protein